MNLLNHMLYGRSLGGNPWKSTMAFKGGKSQSTNTQNSTTTKEVHDAYKADVGLAMGDLRAAYTSGDLSKVAGESALQTEVFNTASGKSEVGLDAIQAARGTMEDAMAGTGMFDPAQIDALEQQAIDQAAKERGVMNDQFASAGAMGGSRQAIAAGDNNAQLANALAQIKYDQMNRKQDNAMWGSQSMTESGGLESQTFINNMTGMAQLGAEQRAIAQEVEDADLKGLEAYMSGITGMSDLITTQRTTSTGTSESSKKGK